MQTLNIPISQLHPYKDNPRSIDDEGMELLKRSMTESPEMLEAKPVLVSDRTGEYVVLSGNQRLEAAKQLGLEYLPCIVASGWSEDMERKAVIIENTHFGDWNEKLRLWADLPIENWGVDDDVVERWANAAKKADWNGIDGEDERPHPDNSLTAKEDDFEQPEPETIKTDIVLGDLITFEKDGVELHRLLCGDSTEAANFDKLTNRKLINIVITSPPYNSKNEGISSDYYGEKKKFYIHKNDNKTQAQYFEFLISVLENIKNIAEENAPILWNVAYNANARSDYGKIVFSDKHGLDVKETIIWDKGSSFNICTKGILSRQCEFIFLLSKSDKYETNQGENEAWWNIVKISSSNSSIESHKATFPVDLPKKLIEMFSKESSIVFDPFLGSGSTMVAAHQLNRRCYGIELEPRYCDIIVRRMLKLDPTLTAKRNSEPYQPID